MAPTPTPTSLPVSTSASPVTSMTSSASASSTTSASTQSGLRAAQKAGIGVGVSLGVLLSCLLCFLFIRYRRRQANSNRGVMEQTDPIPKTDIKPPTTSTNHHVSETETLFSDLSAQNYDEDGNKESVQRPISELMASPPRAELE